LFFSKLTVYLAETQVNCHDLQCDALLTLPTDLSSQIHCNVFTKYIVKYSLLLSVNIHQERRKL